MEGVLNRVSRLELPLYDKINTENVLLALLIILVTSMILIGIYLDVVASPVVISCHSETVVIQHALQSLAEYKPTSKYPQDLCLGGLPGR